MHIKLISPRMTLRPMDSHYKRILSPSVSLLVLAGLTPGEHRVEIADENTGPLETDDTPDLVGITVTVDTAPRAYAVADHYRGRGIQVVLGGIHASSVPDEALQHADAVCIGEAERVWPEILADAAEYALRPSYYAEAAADMADTPLPRWDLVDRAGYLYTSIICASRGCPFACDFCYNSCAYVHNRHRNRPLENVLQEMRTLGTRHVMFIDDNFVGNRRWVQQFAERIMHEGYTWHAAASTDLVHDEPLVDLLARSGCRSLFIGFESINPESIAGVTKRQNRVPLYEKLIGMLHDRGIMVNASMVYGFDSDDEGVFDRTLEWLTRNRIETVTSHILTPYPGTRLYERLLARNRIIDFDYSHYNTSHVVFKPYLMTPEQLYEGYLRVYDEFYSFWSIAQRLPACHASRVPYLLFNLGYRKFGKVTSWLKYAGLMNWVGRLARRLSYGIG